jgi:hypothetical protein
VRLILHEVVVDGNVDVDVVFATKFRVFRGGQSDQRFFASLDRYLGTLEYPAVALHCT